MTASHWRMFVAAILLALTASDCKASDPRFELSISDPCIVASDGSRGVCQLVSQCPWVGTQLRSGKRPTICGFQERIAIVCCKLGTGSSSDIASGPPAEVTRISELKCDEYKRKYEEDLDEPIVPTNKTIKTARVCPLFASSATAGGERATAPGDAPFAVAVGFTSGNLSDIKWSCGGALISGTFVVTSARCSFSLDTASGPTVVRVGVHHLEPNGIGQEKPLDSFYVAKVMVHPNYTGSSSYNDIALLQLETEVRFTKDLRPACLWRSKDINSSSAVALGWGLTGPRRSDNLEKTNLNLIETPVCQTRVQSSKTPNGITAEQLCAGDTSWRRTEPCKVDVGGPLVVASPENDCMFFLVGIMSFLPNCDPGSPAVFSRISSHLPWIESVVWPQN